MSVVRTGRIMFMICLLITCTVLWAAHTFYFVLQYLQSYEKTTIIKTQHDRLSLPSPLICNRFPFTQQGLDRLGSAFNQPLVIEYLQNWLRPSLADLPQSIPQNSTFLRQAELTISQTLLGQSFKDRLDSVMLSCMEMVQECSVQGNRINGIECCTTYVQSYLSTTDGICWLFNTSSLSQKPFGAYQGVRIDFRISRTNFDPVQHPGIDIYLLPSNYSPLQIVTQLQSSSNTHLRNKIGSSLKLTKKTYSRLEKSYDCGYTLADANKADKTAENANSGWIGCLVKATIKACKCVPLNTVLWVYHSDFSGQIISEQNATSICTVGEYDRCARAYMDFTNPQKWHSETPNGRQQVKSDVDECKRQYHLPCQLTEYVAQSTNYPLQQDLQATTDFVASISFGFESLEVEDEVKQQEIPLIELATFAGWNLALWFAIGFIIWLFFTTSCCRYNQRPGSSQQPTKVGPILSMVSSEAGSPVSRPDSGHPLVSNPLPPINSGRSHDLLANQRLHLNSG